MGLPLARIEGKYEIVAKLREGGMGAVYKVRHKLLDELRVIKVLRTQLADDRQLEERFVHEARAAIRLRHPNVVQIFDFSLDDDGHGFLVMEYIHGLDLQQIVGRERRPPLSIALALEIARQSLRALGFLHRQGFVHRDISPDNLMLTRDVDERPLVKMIDLGIAKERGTEASLTATGVFLGKFRYSSPEQFGAEEGTELDERSDLYSFGIVLYQLLTHRFPIAGSTTSQLIGGHLLRPPMPFAESDPERRVPEALRTLVLRCLEKSPADRFSSAAELETAIASLQRSHPLDEDDLAVAQQLVGLVHEGSSTGFEPGSTQGRLDAGFHSEPTPPPTTTTVSPQPREAPPPTPQQQLDAHLLRACELTDQGDDPGAIDELGQAAALQPDNPMILGLLDEARQRVADRESLAVVAATAADLDQLIHGSRLLEADRILFQAEEAHGDQPLLAEARRRLDEAHHRLLETRIEEMLGEATAMRQRGESQEAREILGKALGIAPRGRGLHRRLRQLQKELELRDVAPRPSEELDLLAAARRSQREGDVLRARLLVSQLLERQPGDKEARALARELDGK